MEPDEDKTHAHVFLTGDTMVSHYRIIEKIGSGGMGEVYLAEDTKLDRKVALKFLPVHLASDKALNTRFINEAQAAAKLNHPNIITIFEVSEYEDRPFFVMEYVEGKPLSEVIGSEGLSYDQAIDITLQICEGLKEAHNAGIMHRDIKPSNIIIDKGGRCRILDFGLAAVQSEERITRTGSLLGTVEYMSPEQVSNKKADRRTDIFSLGVLLYEMLTGRLPFKGEYVAGIVYSIINEVPEMLDKYRTDISGGFQTIIDRALEKDPERRYPDIDSLLEDISNLREGSELFKPKTPHPSIAVLPFRDLSAQKDQEYLCDGIAEDIINGLTHLEGLQVVARTSAFLFRRRDIDVREIGRKLNAQSLLEGSIRKTGDRIRVTAQLINVSDGYHIWSERYDRQLEDVFAIQDEISLNIVDRLKVKLMGEERAKLVKRGTANQEAYLLYLKGRYFWNRRYEGGLQKSLEHFQQAIEKDPQFALAYSGLADGFAMLGTYSFLPPNKAFTLAKNTALKALEIDDSLPEAVTSLAYVNMFYDWNWEAAENGYKRAIELDPYYASAHEWYGMLLAITGRYDESIVEMSKARDLDPLGLIINAMLGWNYQCLEQYDKAIEQYQKTIEMDPNFTLAYFFCAAAYIKKSMYKEAVETSQKFIELSGGSQSALGVLGFAYASSGDSVKAHETLDRLKESSGKMHVSPFYTGLIHGALDENDMAFEHLEKACEDREPFLVLLRCWRLIENLHSDERYLPLMKKIGLDK